MSYKAETLAIHAGYTPEAPTKAVAVPIYQTTSYAFDKDPQALAVAAELAQQDSRFQIIPARQLISLHQTHCL